jgi:hypothetical protein
MPDAAPNRGNQRRTTGSFYQRNHGLYYTKGVSGMDAGSLRACGVALAIPVNAGG